MLQVNIQADAEISLSFRADFDPKRVDYFPRRHVKKWWEPTVEMPEPIDDDEGIASARRDRAATPDASVQRW